VSFESDRFAVRVAVDIFMRFARAGKLDLLLGILIGAFKAKLSWDETVARANGSYYEHQVKAATEKYKAEHPADFECRVNVPGWDKWKQSQGS
jgi:hypothetical protein